MGDQGEPAVRALSLSVRRGEIVGIAGVSGNGQRELMQALVGQRARLAAGVSVDGTPFHGPPGREPLRKVRSLPEEPLGNACVS